LLAYYDDEMNVIVSKKKIFINYAKGWLLLDLFACFPFQLLMPSSKDYSSLIRIGRLPRLYRLIKMGKLIRMLKVIKTRNRVMRYMNNLMRVNIGIERLIWFLVTFLIMIHLLACMWIFMGRFNMMNTDENWIMKGNFQDFAEFDLYACAVYWAVTTLTTVGYGDISAHNQSEIISCCIVMVIGIFIYSYIIGSLTNLLQNLDSRKAKLNRKLDILNNISREYQLNKMLHQKISNALEYENSHNNKRELEELIEDLPTSLKSQLLIVIYQKTLENNAFFEKKPTYFVAYIAPLLKPIKVEKDDYVYKIGEHASEMYFVVKGEIAMVMTTNEGTEIAFNIITSGYYFGETDILFSDSKEHSCSVKAQQNSELLAFHRNDLENLLKTFEEESLEILGLAQQRNARLEEKRQEAERQYLEKKQVKRFRSFPVVDFTKEELFDQLQRNQDSFEEEEVPESDRQLLSPRAEEGSANTSIDHQDAIPNKEASIPWFDQLRNVKNSSLFSSIVNSKLGGTEETELAWTKKKIKKLESSVEEVKTMLLKVSQIMNLPEIGPVRVSSSTGVSRENSLTGKPGLLTTLIKEVNKINSEESKDSKNPEDPKDSEKPQDPEDPEE